MDRWFVIEESDLRRGWSDPYDNPIAHALNRCLRTGWKARLAGLQLSGSLRIKLAVERGGEEIGASLADEVSIRLVLAHAVGMFGRESVSAISTRIDGQLADAWKSDGCPLCGPWLRPGPA